LRVILGSQIRQRSLRWTKALDNPLLGGIDVGKGLGESPHAHIPEQCFKEPTSLELTVTGLREPYQNRDETIIDKDETAFVIRAARSDADVLSGDSARHLHTGPHPPQPR
jgi:hypothetical protein